MTRSSTKNKAKKQAARPAGAPKPTAPGTSGGYVCPLTGEILPCPKCCPLNK